MTLENTDGNDAALDAGQANNSSNPANDQVNPGAIRKSQTAGILNALSAAAGQQFDSVEAAVAYMTRTSVQTAAPLQPAATSNQKPTKQKDNDLADQFQALQTKLATQERALQVKELDSDIRSVMGDKFDNDLVDYAMSKVKANIQWNDDGSYSIVNSKGQERYSQEGTPLTLADVVNEVAKGNPKLLKQSSTGGSGLRPGQGNFAGAMSDSVPDYSRDPAAFNAWATKNGLGKNVGLKGLTVTASSSASTRKLV